MNELDEVFNQERIFVLKFYLVGAGLADPDGVLVEPFVFVAEAVPTESREGLNGVVDVVTRRCGMRVCVPSSNQKFIRITKLFLICRLTVAVQ